MTGNSCRYWIGRQKTTKSRFFDWPTTIQIKLTSMQSLRRFTWQQTSDCTPLKKFGPMARFQSSIWATSPCATSRESFSQRWDCFSSIRKTPIQLSCNKCTSSTAVHWRVASCRLSNRSWTPRTRTGFISTCQNQRHCSIIFHGTLCRKNMAARPGQWTLYAHTGSNFWKLTGNQATIWKTENWSWRTTFVWIAQTETEFSTFQRLPQQWRKLATQLRLTSPHDCSQHCPKSSGMSTIKVTELETCFIRRLKLQLDCDMASSFYRRKLTSSLLLVQCFVIPEYQSSERSGSHLRSSHWIQIEIL